MSPPENAEGRPGEKAAYETESANSTVVSQLKRRREASRRLPVLSNGYRDPMDELASDWPSNTNASRAAWHHLNDLGLMSDLVESVLFELAGVS